MIRTRIFTIRKYCLDFCRSQKSFRDFSSLSFDLTQQQNEIQQRVRDFVKTNIIPSASYFDELGELPTSIIETAWKNGFTLGHIPVEYGGIGLDMFTNCLISEELGYGCAAVMLTFEVSSLAQSAVLKFGTKQQQKIYCGRLVEQPILTAFCVTEPEAGSDVSAVKTSATVRGNEFIINGDKTWITNAGIANWFFVLARTADNPKTPSSKAFSAFIVDANTPGIIVGEKFKNMGQRAADIRSLQFEDVRIPKENLLGNLGDGFRITMSTFDKARPLVAAGSIGVSRRCLDECIQYSIKNQSFHNQSVSFMLSDMAMSVEIGRLAYQKAAWEIDERIPNTNTASIAKCFAADTASIVASDAVSIFGMNGFNSNYPVEKLMRDAKASQMYGGTSQIQRIVISRSMFNKK